MNCVQMYSVYSPPHLNLTEQPTTIPCRYGVSLVACLEFACCHGTLHCKTVASLRICQV